jgi:hypothetical protein
MVGAVYDCPICKRLVCETCHADWTTCDQPSGRMVRLGMTGRLRDVDPRGRLGIASWLRGRMRLLDLRRLRWIDGPELPRFGVLGGATFVKLADDERLLYPTFRKTASNSVFEFEHLAALSLRDGSSFEIDVSAPAHGAAINARGDRYSHVATDETVAVVELRWPALSQAAQLLAFGTQPIATGRSFVPLPGKVVQAACVGGDPDRLAASTWSRITLGAIVDRGFTAVGQLVPLGDVDPHGDVRWLDLATSMLAAAVTGPGRTTMMAWRLRDDGSIGELALEAAYRYSVTGASLSRDGRFLAVGSDERVVVHAIDAGTTQAFTEHTDRVGFVRFAGDDHLLITADDDNRVVLRPRVAAGYADVAIPIDIPDEADSIASLPVLAE